MTLNQLLNECEARGFDTPSLHYMIGVWYARYGAMTMSVLLPQASENSIKAEERACRLMGWQDASDDPNVRLPGESDA